MGLILSGQCIFFDAYVTSRPVLGFVKVAHGHNSLPVGAAKQPTQYHCLAFVPVSELLWPNARNSDQAFLCIPVMSCIPNYLHSIDCSSSLEVRRVGSQLNVLHQSEYVYIQVNSRRKACRDLDEPFSSSPPPSTQPDVQTMNKGIQHRPLLSPQQQPALLPRTHAKRS